MTLLVEDTFIAYGAYEINTSIINTEIMQSQFRGSFTFNNKSNI